MTAQARQANPSWTNCSGRPWKNIAAVLAVAFGLAVAYLLYIRLRDPILVRMAFRNVLRRPGQSLLILAGLMLATAIISSAFTVGDSVTYSIKNTAAASLRSVDELLVVDEDSEVWEGRALPDGFSVEVFQELTPALDADANIDGVLPALTEDVAAINPESQQFESSAQLAGLDPPRARVFDELFDTQGAPLDLTLLGPNEVYITDTGAEALRVEPGTVLSVALGRGMLTPITVRGVVDGPYQIRRHRRCPHGVPFLRPRAARSSRRALSHPHLQPRRRFRRHRADGHRDRTLSKQFRRRRQRLGIAASQARCCRSGQ